MRVEEVKKLPPFDRFLYFIKERWQIYVKKEILKRPPPWTENQVLQQNFFTNCYRELDRTTIWMREHIREPLFDRLPELVFACYCFRWFSYIGTGELLVQNGLIEEGWSKGVKQALLDTRQQEGKLFTGGYRINIPSKGSTKIEAICRVLDQVWKDRERICKRMMQGKITLERAHQIAMETHAVGGFMGYEIVSDLRWTPVLDKATDIMTWCNMGPGATWGFHRVQGTVTGLVTTMVDGKRKACAPGPPPLPGNYREMLLQWLEVINTKLKVPKFEMREVEHGICEHNKFERYMLGERARRKYNGKGE